MQHNKLSGEAVEQRQRVLFGREEPSAALGCGGEGSQRRLHGREGIWAESKGVIRH